MAIGQDADGKGDCGGTGVGLGAGGSAVDLQRLKPGAVGFRERAFLGRAILIPWTKAVAQLLSAYVDGGDPVPLRRYL